MIIVCPPIFLSVYLYILHAADTLIPSIDVADVTNTTVSEAFKGIYGKLGQMMMDDINTLRNTTKGHAFLRRGAISAGTNNHVATTLQEALLPGSQKELYLVFSLLNTSLGCFLLTGFAAPFKSLSLRNRTSALQRMRDSYLQPLRAIFQTFRRLTTGMFLAYADRGMSLTD